MHYKTLTGKSTALVKHYLVKQLNQTKPNKRRKVRMWTSAFSSMWKKMTGLRSPRALHNHGCFTGNIDTVESNPRRRSFTHSREAALQIEGGNLAFFLQIHSSVHLKEEKNASLKLLLSLPLFFLSFFPLSLSLSILSTLVSGWGLGCVCECVRECAFSCVFEVLWSEKEALVTGIMAFVLPQKLSLWTNKTHTQQRSTSLSFHP